MEGLPWTGFVARWNPLHSAREPPVQEMGERAAAPRGFVVPPPRLMRAALRVAVPPRDGGKLWITAGDMTLVPEVGLEPTRVFSPADFESAASTDSATPARGRSIAEGAGLSGAAAQRPRAPWRAMPAARTKIRATRASSMRTMVRTRASRAGSGVQAGSRAARRRQPRQDRVGQIESRAARTKAPSEAWNQGGRREKSAPVTTQPRRA